MTGETGAAPEPFDSRDVRPVVALPQAGLSGVGIALLCAILGAILFFVLDSKRRNMASANRNAAPASAMIVSPQPLAVPPAPIERALEPMALPQQIRPFLSTSPLPFPRQGSNVQPSSAYAPQLPPLPPPTLPDRKNGDDRNPVLIIDLASAETVAGAGAGTAGTTTATEAGDDQAVKAKVIRNRANLVAQGSMISAVLETPIDSRRPGLVRAIVSRDARGFDGTRVLIPRGSRLIGEAAGDVKPGQKRVLVTWTRLIRPDGVAIRIGSPAADVLGGAGIQGRVNTHFLERFGNAVLQSALMIGVNIASRPRSGSVIVGVPGQIGTMGQSLLPDVNPGPTIKVRSGAEISVFVARDLDFSGTGLRP